MKALSNSERGNILAFAYATMPQITSTCKVKGADVYLLDEKQLEVFVTRLTDYIMYYIKYKEEADV